MDFSFGHPKKVATDTINIDSINRHRQHSIDHSKLSDDTSEIASLESELALLLEDESTLMLEGVSSLMIEEAPQHRITLFDLEPPAPARKRLLRADRRKGCQKRARLRAPYGHARVDHF